MLCRVCSSLLRKDSYSSGFLCFKYSLLHLLLDPWSRSGVLSIYTHPWMISCSEMLTELTFLLFYFPFGDKLMLFSLMSLLNEHILSFLTVSIVSARCMATTLDWISLSFVFFYNPSFRSSYIVSFAFLLAFDSKLLWRDKLWRLFF